MFRRAFQVAFIALILYAVFSGGDVEKYCPAGGMASLSGQVLHGRMSCQMTGLNIFIFLALALSVVVAGRVFCSYLCPVGTLSEAVSGFGGRLGLARTLPALPDALLRSIKYILLFAVLYNTWISSELFCKVFDPYYAVAGGFNHEVLPWAGALTIALVLIGSLLGRLFWCKYICFFGAAQGVVSTFIGAVAGALFLAAYSVMGLPPAMPWFFAVVCTLGFIGELAGQRLLPIVKILRSVESCNSCGACARVCPHGIPVTEFKKITHPDCFSCGDCIRACPVDGTLTYSPLNSDKLVPALVLLSIVLAFAADYKFGDSSAFATVSLVPENLVLAGTVKSVDFHGLKNIRCYGSSMSLIYRLGRKSREGIKWHEGILGAQAYADSKTLRVFYDESKIQKSDIRKLIYRAVKMSIKPVSSIDKKRVARLARWRAGIWGVVDDIDTMALRGLLSRSPHVFGVSTEWGEPVVATVYYDKSGIGADGLKALLESRKPVMFGKTEMSFEFRVDGKGDTLDPVDTDSFCKEFFPVFDKEIARPGQAGNKPPVVFQVALKGLDVPSRRGDLMWLCWYLKAVDGVLRLRTLLLPEGPRLWIYTEAGRVDAALLKERLSAPKMVMNVRGKKMERTNPFRPVGDIVNIGVPGKN